MKYDDLDILGFWLFCMLALVCGTVIVIREVRKGPPKRNRRRALPMPRPDERSSIEQFKRIHNV